MSRIAQNTVFEFKLCLSTRSRQGATETVPSSQKQAIGQMEWTAGWVTDKPMKIQLFGILQITSTMTPPGYRWKPSRTVGGDERVPRPCRCNQAKRSRPPRSTSKYHRRAAANDIGMAGTPTNSTPQPARTRSRPTQVRNRGR